MRLQAESYINKPSLTSLTMIETVKVSSKGQMVIPEEIRKEFHIIEGTKLILVTEKGKIILQREEEFLKKMQKNDQEEKGWLELGEKSMEEIWDNPKDEKIWKKYL